MWRQQKSAPKTVEPHIFEEEKIAVTVTSQLHVDMLKNFLCLELQRHHVDKSKMWFQHDGATAQTTTASLEVVGPMFQGHIISRFGDVP